MGSDQPHGEFPEHAGENRRVWDANAEWWDDRIGDGNDFQRELIEPATERLLALAPGDLVLDVACGAGRFARRMAELGARVVAFDQSAKFIERARQRTPPTANIEYRLLDAADEAQLLALGAARFDWAVCTMALMDMPAIEPLFRALPQLLKPGGRFVFSVTHPCFNSAAIARFSEQSEDEAGRLVTRTGVKVWAYRAPYVRKGEGIAGQPEPQPYFHRPLCMLLGVGFRAGFVVDGLEEPTLPLAADDRRCLRWEDMPDIPPVLAVRMRLVQDTRPR